MIPLKIDQYVPESYYVLPLAIEPDHAFHLIAPQIFS